MKTGPEALEVVAGVVRRGGRILICQRPEGKHLAGLWEFPGGKVERGESPEEALARELREELEVEIEVGALRWETRHAYPDRHVHLRFYDCEWKRGEGKDNGAARHAWVHPSRLGEYAFLPADAPLIRELGGAQAPGTGSGEAEASSRFCQALAARHYENFPVASWLLPRGMRPHLAAVYAFARTADDIADSTGPPAERLARLDAMERGLQAAAEGKGEGPVFAALAGTLLAHALPIQPFRDLLSAFRQDVEVSRYPDYGALLDYCRRSANPVGRIVLEMWGIRDAEALRASDAICTALQIANHLQDLKADCLRGVVYLPQDEMEAFGVDERELGGETAGPALRALLIFQVGRARRLLAEGLPLLRMVRGPLARELRAVWRGGAAALESIERASYDVLKAAPRLDAWDRAGCFLAAFLPAGRLARRADPAREARDAQDYCRWLVRRSRSNFSLAFLALPRGRRRGLNAIYAFCRMVDDIADTPGDPGEKRRRLARWKEALARFHAGGHRHPILRELAWTDAAFGVPLHRLVEVCEGVEMDVGHRRFPDFPSLLSYCGKVASAVGLACLGVLGARTAAGERYAHALGVALQLTNILRDVRADAQAGRLYLPLEDLARFGVSEDAILRGEYNERVVALLRLQADRARSYFAEAQAHLPREAMGPLFPARLMGRIYRRMLEELDGAGFPPGGWRPPLSTLAKLREALRCYLER
ncbi:MAG: squalene synthase HpnC [Nitrospinota bacterium]